MHPETGDQIDRCFYYLKEPEKSAHQRHGDIAELRDAAGDLFCVPDFRTSSLSVCRNPGSFLIISSKDMSGYKLCGRFEYFGSYFGNRG